MYTRVFKYGLLMPQVIDCKTRVYKGVVYQSMVKSMYQGDMQGPAIHLLLLLLLIRIFMSSMFTSRLISTWTKQSPSAHVHVHVLSWRLKASQKQLAKCPEHEALQTIVMARNANGGIRNCCQSWELLDVGKPSDWTVADRKRLCPPAPLLLTSPTTAGNSQAGQMTWHVRGAWG